MKQILLSIILGITCLVSVSCTSTPPSIIVDGINITGSKKLGGKQMAYVKKGETVVILADNNEKSFQDGAGVAKFGIGAIAATNIFSTGASAWQSVTNSKTAAEVSKTGLKEATSQLGITEATKVKGMELEAAAMEMGLGQ